MILQEKVYTDFFLLQVRFLYHFDARLKVDFLYVQRNVNGEADELDRTGANNPYVIGGWV